MDKAFDTNRGSVDFLKWLIICLTIVGIIMAILAYCISIFVGIIEVLIAPALVWAIRALSSINNNNAQILNGASKILKNARGQSEIEQRITMEIQLEKEKGG